jgi:hypothetical protein
MDEPPTLSYGTALGDRPPRSAYDNVPSGFLWSMLTIPVLAATFAASVSDAALVLVAISIIAALVGFGLWRGLRWSRWGFLRGAVLFAVLLVVFAVFVFCAA